MQNTCIWSSKRNQLSCLCVELLYHFSFKLQITKKVTCWHQFQTENVLHSNHWHAVCAQLGSLHLRLALGFSAKNERNLEYFTILLTVIFSNNI